MPLAPEASSPSDGLAGVVAARSDPDERPRLLFEVYADEAAALGGGLGADDRSPSD